ncbi:MAG: hypothetical protein HY506_01740, partial [Candidatus Yanofskybacteria bacterium]|nr:hypothetical protein [Candidatus Yanofskybacteria bacterium]
MLIAKYLVMINEFRQDLVSGEWILFATGRAKRPGSHGLQKQDTPVATKPCPFDDPESSGNEVMATYFNRDQSDWIAKAIKNKYPAVLEGDAESLKKIGPFSVVDGHGRHEVIVFRDHEKQFYDFSRDEIAEVVRVYQERYVSMFDGGSLRYILIFHNHGLTAGASIPHSHSQVIAIPILPPDVKRSINGSEEFYKKNGEIIYDVMIEWETKEKKRIIYENESFIAFCPFVSKAPYEIRIFPKESHAHFEKMPESLRPQLADIMYAVLAQMNKSLDGPDFNFFIHTAQLESG